MDSARVTQFEVNYKNNIDSTYSKGSSRFNSIDKISFLSFETLSQDGYQMHANNQQAYQNVDDEFDFQIFQNYDESLDFMDSLNKNKQFFNQIQQNFAGFQQYEQEIQQISNFDQIENHDQNDKINSKENNDRNMNIDLGIDLDEFGNTLQSIKQQLPAYRQQQLQIKTLIDLQQAFNKDKQKIQDHMAKCLISIYNQQDMSEYLADMISISQIMKKHYQDFQNCQLIKSQLSQIKVKSLIRLKQLIQSQVSPKYLMKMISEIIGDIMNNIREQVLNKMKKLGVLVKEPVYRRASHDDYNLCFENSIKKSPNGQYSNQINLFGYGINNANIFTNQINLRNLNDSNDIDNDFSPISARNNNQLNNDRQYQNDCQVSNSNFGKKVNAAYKQQQELHLDNGKNYEFIRKEGRKNTWQDIWQSRKRLQRFIHRQNEYKKVFDMILRSYRQLKGSLEYLEEFWIYLNESIYGQIQTGKLQFDRIWKDIYHERILDNQFIKHFLNDVSDQYEGLQTYHQKQTNPTSSRYILDEIYENLVKLETDLNQDYVIEEFLQQSSLIGDQSTPNDLMDNAEDEQLIGENLQYNSLEQFDVYNSIYQSNLIQTQIEYVISNQYELMQEKMKCRYGGKSLAQIIDKYQTLNPQQIQNSIAQGDSSQAQVNIQKRYASSGALKADKGAAEVKSESKNQQLGSKKKRNKQKKNIDSQCQDYNFDSRINFPEQSQKQESVPQYQNPKQLFKKIVLNKPAKNQPFLKKFKEETNNIEACKNENTELSNSKQCEQKATENDLDKEADKKKKLNKKKKRQRQEKKKRQQEQNDLIMYQQEQQRKKDEIEEQELIELIYQYDSQMSQNDQEYLMQVEDRQAVINTLKAKLLERDTSNQVYQQIYYNPEQNHYYNEEGEYNSSGIDDPFVVEGVQIVDNIYPQDELSQNISQLNDLKQQALNDRYQLGLIHKEDFKMQTQAAPNASNKTRQASDQSNISFEEEIYDSEFEQELKIFQWKLQTTEKEVGHHRHKNEQQRKIGSQTHNKRKLIPNVSPEWIDKLRKQLKQQTLCRSLDYQNDQIRDQNMINKSVLTQESSSGHPNYAQNQMPLNNTKLLHLTDINMQGSSKVFQTSRGKMSKIALNQCNTNSTGMSYNSPPATERACGYEADPNGGQVVDIYSAEAEGNHFYYGEIQPNNSYQLNLQNYKQIQNSEYINIEDEDHQNERQERSSPLNSDKNNNSVQNKSKLIKGGHQKMNKAQAGNSHSYIAANPQYLHLDNQHQSA